MYDCKDCMQFFAHCPCCGLAFCPSCGKTEHDENEEGEENE